ncbi:MAG: helix-turn-helix transcriptional regulator [Candidatus Competibacteraceae bacterium]|nr:helix-turn-helix transcriptional regulator [Candidatus Competibacteraceae bacterium]
MAIFCFIASGDEPVSMREIVDELLLSFPTAKKYIEHLLAAGMIKVALRKGRRRLYSLSDRWETEGSLLTFYVPPVCIAIDLGTIDTVFHSAERIVNNGNRKSSKDEASQD